MNKNILIWLLGSLVLLGTVGFGVWYYYIRTPAPLYSSTNTISATLMRTNSDFAKAQNLRESGDYVQALAAYQAALPNAADTFQKAIIDIYIAYTTSLAGDPIEAIRLYKQIAANTAYMPVTRAYAVLYMGSVYYFTPDPSITAEIFKDEPYTSFFVSGDTALSYRHLFEYSSSFYPLALSELRIARWYASRILTLYKTSSGSPEIAVDKAIIDEKLKNADAEIERTQQYPNVNQLIPISLTHKAVVLGELSYLDFASSTDAESAYKAALAAYAQFDLKKGSDSILRYQYAWFLLNAYGKERSVDIVQLLKPTYTEPEYRESANNAFFKNALKISDIRKEKLQSLALLVPEFKAFLISLGWEVADFKK